MKGIILYGLVFFELIGTAVMAYAIATSRAKSKAIIKSVLIGTGVCMVLQLFMAGIPIISCLVIFIALCVLGAQTGNKFNLLGVISLVVYLFTLFNLPVISNKYEDTDSFALIDGLASSFDIDLAPTQIGIIEFAGENSIEGAETLVLMFAGVVFFAFLFLCMALIRKNGAQVILGSIIAVLSAGMVYFDYSIFHAKSTAGKLTGYALSKLGFSLSMSVVVMLAFAVLPAVIAYRYNVKEKEKENRKAGN